MAIILGVDPGSRITGYGIIRAEGRHVQYIDSGCIRVGEKPMPERLQTIFHSLATLIGEFRPEEFAIEQVFMARNPDSALKLGQARGRPSSVPPTAVSPFMSIPPARSSRPWSARVEQTNPRFSTWCRCSLPCRPDPRRMRRMPWPLRCVTPT